MIEKNEGSNVALILLAGGVGRRMGMAIPKQFAAICGNQTVVTHALQCFLNACSFAQYVVVCEPEYRYFFDGIDWPSSVSFALPGYRRQDSVYNGFQLVNSDISYVMVHDGARPFVAKEIIVNTLKAAKQCGAAAAAVPVKATIKMADGNGIVKKTLDRSLLWEMQTPQCIERNLMARAFAYALEHDIDVTDDISLVELLDAKAKLVLADYNNIKLTTPEDMIIAQGIAQRIYCHG